MTVAVAVDDLASRLDCAARYAALGDWTTAKAVIDVAALHPEAARHADRIKAAREWLVRKGVYDQEWVPEVRGWKECELFSHACPNADAACRQGCGLVEGGWPEESQQRRMI